MPVLLYQFKGKMSYNKSMNSDLINKLNEVSNGSDLGSFIENYRTALEDQYTADRNALETQRKIGQTGIMSGANRAGLLHSSFPTINKLKYDVNTYEPALVKLRQGYQTGMDTLYSNVAKYYNTIKKYQDDIAHLNSLR